VTHDLDFAAKTQRTITMEDGKLTHTIHWSERCSNA
jgi:predicted ABC-type transport system involved in lysophospholipase L1 biosynthesis ATPase subunit